MRGNTGAREKASGLAHRWPLLADGQDPESLEARVAYHFRRLGISWKAVRATGVAPRDALDGVLQGRVPLGAETVEMLARKLGVSSAELSRPLTEVEGAAWAFYRRSARHRQHVWRRAQASWERAGLSLRLAAGVMDLRAYQLSHALYDHRRGLVMGYEAASALSGAVRLEAGPEFFVMNVDRCEGPEVGVAEAVVKLSADEIARLYADVRQGEKSLRGVGGRE